MGTFPIWQARLEEDGAGAGRKKKAKLLGEEHDPLGGDPLSAVDL